MFSLCLVVLIFIETPVFSYVIDVDDILNENYMPGRILLLENAGNIDSNVSTETPSSLDGSWNNAFGTMGFHRKMMNEYLCRNFIAEQILSEMPLSRIKRRLGGPITKNNISSSSTKPAQHRMDVKDTLLFDAGSSNYKDWLAKSTTLEDIYRHYDVMKGKKAQDREDNDDEREEEYDGEVTGYAMQTPNQQSDRNHGPSKLAGSGYASTGDGYPGDYVGQRHYSDHSLKHVHYYHDHHNDKGHYDIALNDIYEIALTALAFISFGMFVLQVIMCISVSGHATTVMPVMMMTVPSNGNGNGDDGNGDDGGDTEGVRNSWRHKRNIPENRQNNVALNELAKRILVSIRSAIIADKDDGNCLKKYLCENNKYSRLLKDNQRIWIPVWSLGMSWLAGRLVNDVPPTTVMLDSLKASILGLGDANCEAIYKDCDLEKHK